MADNRRPLTKQERQQRQKQLDARLRAKAAGLASPADQAAPNAASVSSDAPAPKARGRPKRPDVSAADVTGLKYFERLAPLLERLRDVACERDTAGNRDLHYDQFCLLLLFGPVHLLRVGLDQIDKTTETCSDRVWIMDHMIAAGSLNCLIVLGISAEVFAQLNRPLEHRDVDVLTLIPTEVSNGAVVKDQLNELNGRRGVPLAILTDCGSDLKKGVELFQQTHPETISLYDIVHLACRLIWKRLGKEDPFSQYRQAGCRCANKLRQSPLAHLKPPRPKTKARYLNLDPEIRWGRRALWLLDRVRGRDLTDRQKERLDRQQVEAQLGWLEEYREELKVWTELCEVGQASCTVVRRCGYSRATVAELKATLGPGKTPAAQGLIAELTSVVEQQCDRCERHPSRLPGSSEVIESLIGKGKRLVGTSQNGHHRYV